ncbi:TPA: hypothetical protein I8Y21_005768 [Klebsiella oxytoca]|uniref:Uncharacterized protein n=1 Tax=Klebsiella oxytoca TaxID=571 RepID=A0AAN5LEC9_KLEOX|nr:hypothetical protein [Klebsiella oxytoca]
MRVEGDTQLNNAIVSGSTVNVSGVDVSGNLTNHGNTTITGNASGAASDSNGVSLGGNVAGGNITGHSDNGTGVNISGNSTLTDVMVNGHTVTGVGVGMNGHLTNAGSTTVSGHATENGDGVHLGDGSSITGGLVSGDSVSGSGIHQEGNTSLHNVTLHGSTTHGTGLVVDGTLNRDEHATVTGTVNPGGNGQSMSGGGSIRVVPSSSLQRYQMKAEREQAVTGAMGRGPVRPQAGYQPASAPVSLEVCDEAHCRSLKMDVNKAGAGQWSTTDAVRASGK